MIRQWSLYANIILLKIICNYFDYIRKVSGIFFKSFWFLINCTRSTIKSSMGYFFGSFQNTFFLCVFELKCLVIPLLSIRVLIVTKKRPFYVKSLTNGLEEKNLELVFPWLWITVVTVWTGAENCSIATQNIIMSSSAMSRDSV